MVNGSSEVFEFFRLISTTFLTTKLCYVTYVKVGNASGFMTEPSAISDCCRGNFYGV